jgi:arylformamidase
MGLIDISPPLRVGMGVFPGDAAFQTAQTFTIGPNCPVNVAEIAMSTHCGAHADAPLHYDPNGASIDTLDLSDFIGPARVVDARGENALCGFEEIAAALDVRLIGVDVPSIDPETSKELPSHMVCRAHDLRIIENLVLADVAPGDYELIALPLKLAGLDAAPVRAVLRR